jgi:predicted AAA+ superfamily ATPase
MTSYQRAITDDLLSSLQNMPAVFINGPRQAGKSTLVQNAIAAKKLRQISLPLMIPLL